MIGQHPGGKRRLRRPHRRNTVERQDETHDPHGPPGESGTRDPRQQNQKNKGTQCRLPGKLDVGWHQKHIGAENQPAPPVQQRRCAVPRICSQWKLTPRHGPHAESCQDERPCGNHHGPLATEFSVKLPREQRQRHPRHRMDQGSCQHHDDHRHPRPRDPSGLQQQGSQNTDQRKTLWYAAETDGCLKVKAAEEEQRGTGQRRRQRASLDETHPRQQRRRQAVQRPGQGMARHRQGGEGLDEERCHRWHVLDALTIREWTEGWGEPCQDAEHRQGSGRYEQRV